MAILPGLSAFAPTDTRSAGGKVARTFLSAHTGRRDACTTLGCVDCERGRDKDKIEAAIDMRYIKWRGKEWQSDSFSLGCYIPRPR
jgi:hypothetical protein